MAKDLEFSIVAKFKDLASKGMNALARNAKTAFVGKRGILGTLGLGGLATGGIFGVLVSGAKVAMSGVLGVVRAGLGIVTGAVRAAINIVTGIVRVGMRVVTGIVKGAFKAVATAVLAAGAFTAWQFVKGIRENMKLADIRQVLRKLLGDAAKDAEKYARDLSLRTPFTPMQMLQSTAGLAAIRADYRRFLGDLADWAAGASVPLEQIVTLFQRAYTGQFGEAMEGARRALISMRDLQREGATFSGQNQFQGTPEQFVGYLMAAVQRRFGGMAATAATVGSGPWSTFVGAVQDLRVQLTEPWYERFNKGLSDLNEWLIKLVGGDRFKKLVDWSAKWAEVVDTKVRAAIAWLTGIDWSAEGFKRMLGSIREGIVGLLADIQATLPELLGIMMRGADAIAKYVWSLLSDLIRRFETQINSTLDRLIGAARQQSAALQQGALGRTIGGAMRERVPGWLRWITPGAKGAEWLFGGKLTPAGAAQMKLGEAFGGVAKLLQAMRTQMTEMAGNAAAAEQAAQQAGFEFLRAGEEMKDEIRKLQGDFLDLRMRFRRLSEART